MAARRRWRRERVNVSIREAIQVVLADDILLTLPLGNVIFIAFSSWCDSFFNVTPPSPKHAGHRHKFGCNNYLLCFSIDRYLLAIFALMAASKSPNSCFKRNLDK